MAGIFTRFTRRTLARNRVRTAVTVVGIALSTALLAAVLTSVASVQQGLFERTLATEGSWHVYSPDVTAQAVDALKDADETRALATFTLYGTAALTEQDARSLGSFIGVKSLPSTVKGADEPDGAPFALMPELLEGREPETADEVLLPDYFKGETLGADGAPGASSNGPLEVGGTVTADFGALAAADGETRIEEARERTLTVVGFYRHQPGFLGNNYTAAESSAVALTVADAAEGAGAASSPAAKTGVYVVTQGVSSLDGMHAFFERATGVGEAASTLYHTNLFRYLGVSDGRAIWDAPWMVAAVLAAVIVVASVSLIYNAFAISVAERTRQFGLLASLGASKRQLRRTVLVEALLLGAVGVPAGLLVGVAGTAGVFAVSQEAFAAMLGESGGLSVHLSAPILAAAAALSFVTLLVSAWVPAARAARVSAVDAIRQTQDVRLSKRATRKAASDGRGSGGPCAVKLGLAGRLCGIPGFVAHRNLSRAASRGRTVVASLAVSVALVVTTGSVALYLEPLSQRAGGSGGAGSGADIVASVYANNEGMRESAILSDRADEFDRFVERASRIEGVELIGSTRQGQTECVIPADLITPEARQTREAYQEQIAADWVPRAFDAQGAYYGEVTLFYLDAGAWEALVDELGLDAAAYSDPANPRAIGLDVYQDTLPDGSYVSAKPFAGTGPVTLYAIEEREGFSSMGMTKGDDGEPAVCYLDQEAADGAGGGLISVPADEAAAAYPLEIGALAADEPAAVNAAAGGQRFPALLLPESAAAGAASGDGQASPYAYSFASLSFTAEDHAQAVAELEELAKDYDGLSVNVNDIVESARQNRLILQSIQLFVLCFSLITVLIAVANVFNTLANGIILRTREFATLRSVGMGNRAFARMLAYECASYALRGLAIGLAVAVAVAFLLFKATSLAFAGLAFTLPWSYVALAAGIVCAVLALSVAYALHRSHAASIVESLRSDAI